MAALRFKFNERGLRDRVRVDLMVPTGVVRTDVQRRAANVRNRAQQLLRQRSEESTGEIEGTIRYVTVQKGPDQVVAQIGSDHPAAEYVERGTGLFGPHHTRIVPRHRKSLYFQSRKFGAVFADSSKGQPGKHYLRDALDASIF